MNRSKRVDPYLEWKVRIFSVAAVIGLCGIYFDERWMTGIAIVLLASAMALRFLPGGAVVEEGDAGDDASEARDPNDERGRTGAGTEGGGDSTLEGAGPATSGEGRP